MNTPSLIKTTSFIKMKIYFNKLITTYKNYEGFRVDIFPTCHLAYSERVF